MKRPKAAEQVRIMETALELLPAALAQCHANDPLSCIRNSRTLLDIFRAFGMKAEPFPCRIVIFNPAGARLMDAEGRLPATEDREGWDRWIAAGAFYIATPMGEVLPGRYNGHLILKVEDRWLVDGSIQQCHRPEKGIHLPEPLLIEIPKSQRDQTAWYLQGPGGILVLIRRDDTLRGYGGLAYDACPGWQRRPAWMAMTAALVAEIRRRKGGP